MLNDPRRVGQIDVTLHFPPALKADEKERNILERIGNNCPVAKSLNSEIKINVEYNWK